MNKRMTFISGMVMRGVLTVAAWLGVAASLPAATWTGGTGTWADNDNSPWQTTAPVAAEVVNLTQATASGIVVTYAGNQVLGLTGTELVAGTRFGNLALNNSGGGTTTLAVGTSDMLPAGSATVGAGGKLDISGGTFTPSTSLYLNGGQIVQTGGLIQPLYYDLVARQGTMTVSGGEANFRVISSGQSEYGAPYGSVAVGITGSGILRTRSTSFSIGANDPAAAATFTVNGGSLIAASQLYVRGANGRLDLQAGSVNAQHLSLTGGTYNQTGGTLTLMFDITATSGQATLDGASSAANLRTLYLGTGADSATAEIKNGVVAILSGNTAISVGGSTGSGTLTIDGATARATTGGNHVTIGAGGAIVLQNSGFLGTAAILFGNLTVNGGGSLTVSTGSEARFMYDSAINAGSVTINNGIYTARAMSIGTSGGSGVVTLNGGATTYGRSSGGLTVGGTTGSGVLRIDGGALTNGNTAGHLVVNPTGVLQGRVTVGGTVHAQLHNSGRIIADGGTLDLSVYTGSGIANSVLNPTDNASDKGWFAVNQGKLILPSRTPVTGNSTVNWGEPDADASIDLVNSARLAFTGLTQTGTMGWSGALLAVDHPDVAAPSPSNRALVSVHQFASFGFSLTGVTVTIRYDPAAVAALGLDESTVQLWLAVGGAWVDVTGTRDTETRRVTSTSVGTLGQFAITAQLPSSGTLISIR